MYIVTGGAGFIGSVLLKLLNDQGVSDILLVDELGCSSKWLNIKQKRFSEYMHKDAFIAAIEQDSLPGIPLDTVKGIVHLGACSTTTEENMDYLMKNNVAYSKKLCRFAASHGIRFIYASSAATYGMGEGGFSDDHASVANLAPLNRYGYSKQLFDLWALSNGALDHCVGLKFFNVYGPNEYHKGKMLGPAKWGFDQAVQTGTIKLFKSYREDYADGEQQRDFIYVKDCAEVIWWLLNNPEVNGLYNLGTGTARSWNDVAHAVFAALEKQPKVEYIEMRAELVDQYQYFTEAQMDKLKAAECPVQFTSLEDGVADYVRNYLNTENPYL